MNDDNVFAFPVPASRRGQDEVDAQHDDLLLHLVPRDHDACDHRSTTINDQARTLTCATCGVPIDPIDLLVRLARQSELYVRQINDLRKDLGDLHRAKLRLERDERNAKNRIATAHRRLDAIPLERARLEAAARAYHDRPVGLKPTAFDELAPDVREAVIDRIRPALYAYLNP